MVPTETFALSSGVQFPGGIVRPESVETSQSQPLPVGANNAAPAAHAPALPSAWSSPKPVAVPISIVTVPPVPPVVVASLPAVASVAVATCVPYVVRAVLIASPGSRYCLPTNRSSLACRWIAGGTPWFARPETACYPVQRCQVPGYRRSLLRLSPTGCYCLSCSAR